MTHGLGVFKVRWMQDLELSSLTNLFTEHKFWGWAGLISIFVALAAIFYFQFQVWEQEDQEQKYK